MTIEEFRETDWYKERPKVIQEAIDILPPTKLYSLNGRQCYIISYGEPEKEEDKVTVTVQKTGIGGPLAEVGLGELDTNQVFGIELTDLTEWPADAKSPT